MIPYSLQSISLFQLRYFVSVAKNASFSKAAIECHVAQTAISQQISSLEKTLGFTLFERDNRQVKLTGVGKIFYEYVNGIMLTLENSFLEMEQVSNVKFHNGKTTSSSEYNIRVGYYGGWEQMILPIMFRMFKSEYPGATVTSNFIRPLNIMDALSQNIVDVIFTSAIHKFAIPNVEYMVVDKSPISLIVPVDHRFANREAVSVNELASEYFVPFSPTNSDQSFASYVNNNIVVTDHFSAMIPHLSMDMHNILIAVESGLGVSFCPDATKNYIARSKVRFLKLKEPTTPVTMHCAWKSNNENEALFSFLETIRGYVSKIGLNEDPFL